METFVEISVPRKNSFKDILVNYAIALLPVIVGTYILMLIVNTGKSALLPIAFLLCIGLLYVSYKLYLRSFVEWEYSLVENEIRFAKIINKTRRRDVVTVSVSDAKIIARTYDNDNNHSFKSFTGKKYNLTSQTKKSSYYIISKDSKNMEVCVLFEPDERMIENFRITAHGKFFK